MLTSRQQALLVCIHDHLTHTGRAPSFDTMRYAVKAASMSSVYEAVSVLEQKGFIFRPEKRRRDIRVARMPDVSDVEAWHGQYPQAQLTL
jgi:SOS-response transcriptional repressor LexA